MEKYDALVSLSFGKGTTNNYLANIIRELYLNCSVDKVIVQKEIADELPADRFDILVIREHRQEGKYLDTIEVLGQVKELLISSFTLKKPKILLVAHPLHFYRAWKIAEKMGFKVIEGRVPEMRFDRKDPQIWCRNWFFFRIWDLAGRIKYYLK